MHAHNLIHQDKEIMPCHEGLDTVIDYEGQIDANLYSAVR